MTKLLNLTIKINDKNQYKDETVLFKRVIEPTSLEIKDQTGGSISELKFRNSSGAISRVKLPVNKIKKIKISSSFLDIPISWAWENKLGTTAQLTLKGIKYDEEKGFLTEKGTLLLQEQNDFETEVFKSQQEEFHRSWQVIELTNEGDNPIFYDFSDLWWKITKASGEEYVNSLVPEVEKITTELDWMDFHDLKNINNGEEEVKKMCQDFIKEVQELDDWKKVGIKTLLATRIAKKNGFDLLNNLDLQEEISDGKYYGFPVATGEKYQTLITLTTSFFSSVPSSLFFLTDKNRYTKENIDTFREVFPNDKDQSNPKYFRGFRPGDIEKINGKFFSVFHQGDIKDKNHHPREIEIDEEFTRTYYELESCCWSKSEADNKLKWIKEIIFRPEAFNEWDNKTKKEQWDFYCKWMNSIWKNGFVETIFAELHHQLTNLFVLLDKSYASENKENCEAGLHILKNYESPAASSDEEAIKNKFSAEIEAKKNEITDRMKVLFQADIDAAANEDYGSGRLSSERKIIFTTYRSQIETLSLLTEIKELIKSLVKAEKFIAEFKNLDKMASAEKLKEEYQNGSGDKKTAYTVVNQVDNQWVDRIITELEIIKRKDPQILLAESRTQLKNKYANDAVAQAIFDNNILDSAAALQAAEKLLIKVREAESQNDVDVSLLTLLQGYQEAETGTLKNKAWQAVNSHNQQAEMALARLQKADQSREEAAKALQEAKNESELESAYNRIKDSELYKKGGSSKKVIKNLRRRKRVSFQLDQENFSVENKIFLQTALVKLIPETIKDDNDEQELTELENQLKTFQTASESEEKGEIYQKYKRTIDQVLTEIRQEKQRYQQTKLQDSKEEQTPKGDNQNPSSGGRLPDWAWGLIIMGVIVVTGTVLLYSILYFHQRSGQGSSTKSIKKN